MRDIALAFIIGAGLAITSAALPAFAQDEAPAEDATQTDQTTTATGEDDRTLQTVVATVDGEDITEADLAFAAEDLAEDMQNVPAGQRRSFLLGVLIDMKILANAAEAEGLDDSDIFQQRLDYLADRALRRAYFSSNIAAEIDEEALRAEYDRIAEDMGGEQQIRARHILVETEEEANSVISEIEGGRAFEEVAQEMSTGPSAAQGGDLGFFGRGQMVGPFEEVAFELEDGEISEPVQTQFGWHVIKLEERRDATPPPFEQIAQQLQQQLLVEAFETAIDDLKSDAEVEILAEDLQPQDAPTEDVLPDAAE